MHGGGHGHSGGLTGFHGGGGHCGPGGVYAGPHGAASIAFGVTAAMDFIGGARSRQPDAGDATLLNAQGDANSLPDKDVLVINDRHGEINPHALFISSMEAAGFRLVKAPFSIHGEPRPLVDEGWEDGILPVTAWARITSGPDCGPLPEGMGDKGGKTRRFRYFYQVVKKEWWWLIYEPEPQPDKNANCFLDVAGMAWRSEEFGDYHSQLLIRLVTRKAYEKVVGDYLRNDPAVQLHRRAQWAAARKFNQLIGLYKPSAVSVEARRRDDEARAAFERSLSAGPAPVAEGASESAPAARPASLATGSDLRSALGGTPTGTAPAEGADGSTVPVSITLPPRTT